MIQPTYYRSQLSEYQQEAYRTLVATLLRKERTALFVPPVPDIDLVIKAVHKDHPELFYPNYWTYKTFLLPGSNLCFRVELPFLFEEDWAIDAIAALVSENIHEVKRACSGTPEDRLYRKLATIIAKTVQYQRQDNEDAYLFHTAAGAIQHKRSVCEGISKLFLLYCQHMRLPCLIVSGTLNGVPHAWNMVLHNNRPRHIDVTAELCLARATGVCSPFLFQTDAQLRMAGYEWNCDIPQAR